MKGKTMRKVIIACFLLCVLAATNGLAQGTSADNSAKVQGQQGLKMTIQGIIKQKMGGGYFIRSRPEVFTIANPNPEVLEPLVKSGEMLSIEALASGDRMTIITINGKKY
jgi:hypothetical protein